MGQTAASHPKFAVTPTFIFCSPMCPDGYSVIFCENIFQFREMILFVRPLKNATFHREYYPTSVTSCNEFT